MDTTRVKTQPVTVHSAAKPTPLVPFSWHPLQPGVCMRTVNVAVAAFARELPSTLTDTLEIESRGVRSTIGGKDRLGLRLGLALALKLAAGLGLGLAGGWLALALRLALALAEGIEPGV